MKTYHYIIDIFEFDSKLTISKLNDCSLLIDIETTGFSPKRSCVYMIGAAYKEGSNIHIIQWLDDTGEDEAKVLEAFLCKASSFSSLLHFNGSSFDLPFLEKRAALYNMTFTLSLLPGTDLYRSFSSFSHLFPLSDGKQKSYEKLLGINRKDQYSGGELITVYKKYLATKDSEKEALLLMHNYEDIKGMVSLLSLFSYYDVFYHDISSISYQRHAYHDLDHLEREELLLSFPLPSEVPFPLSARTEDCYLLLKDQTGKLRIPIIHEELKLFFSEYKNYYYLPMEDMAVHKTVSSYLPADHRKKATPSTCYTRRTDFFLPQWEEIYTPCFSKDYKSQPYYFIYSDDVLKNDTLLSRYVTHIMRLFLKKKK